MTKCPECGWPIGQHKYSCSQPERQPRAADAAEWCLECGSRILFGRCENSRCARFRVDKPKPAQQGEDPLAGTMDAIASRAGRTQLYADLANTEPDRPSPSAEPLREFWMCETQRLTGTSRHVRTEPPERPDDYDTVIHVREVKE